MHVSVGNKELQVPLGVKTISEIERLSKTSPWKAIYWIHSVLLHQLKMLFYSGNQVVDFNNLPSDFSKKWKVVGQKLKYFEPASELCYCRSLINNEYGDLKKFNTFRNSIGHPDFNQHLPSDDKAKEIAELGLKLVKQLDRRIAALMKF